MSTVTVRTPSKVWSAVTVSAGSGRSAASVGPVTRSGLRIGNLSLRSAVFETYCRVHGRPASELAQYAVSVSASRAYMSWVGAGRTWSNRSTASPVATNATVSTPARTAGPAANYRRRAFSVGYTH